MQLQKKAAYNLVWINYKELIDGKDQEAVDSLPEWQKNNFREYTEEQLFQDLKEMGILFDQRSFVETGRQFDTPEQMAETLCSHIEKPLCKDHAYLLVFELWRRYLPERQSLSIVCDELDHLIMLYDSKKLENREALQNQIDLLKTIIEDNVDSGINAKEAFRQVENHTANGIEDFLYDYILDLIKNEDLRYAEELIEGFKPYLSDPRWFDFLKAQILIKNDPEEGFQLIENLILEEENPSNVELYLEMLSFLANTGSSQLFMEAGKKTLPELQTEQDLSDFVRALILFYSKNGYAEEKKQIQQIMESRSSISKETPFNPTDSVTEKLLHTLSPKTEAL